MMRAGLKEKAGTRSVYIGEFVRTGTKHGYKGDIETVLLKDIKDVDGNIMTDHLWFNMTKGFQDANLKAGDIIEFRGKAEEYERGYNGYREDVYVPHSKDFKLSRPTKIKKIN